MNSLPIHLNAKTESNPSAAGKFYRQTSPSIRWWFLVVGLVVLGPLLFLTTYQIVQIQEARQKAIERDLADRTQSAAFAVSTRLQVGIGHLDSLASTDAALSGDFKSLHRQAQRVSQKIAGLTGIGLMNRDLTMHFITSKPYGALLPKPPSTRMAETVFATEQPAVSGIFEGPFSGKKVVSLGIPLFQNGVVTHCLFMAVSSDAWSELLKSQQLPDEWRIALIDQDGLTIGRNVLPERYVGTPVVTEFIEQMRAGQSGLTSFTIKEGLPSIGFSAKIPGYRWLIAAAVPRMVVEAPLRSRLAWLMGTAIGMFMLMGLLAYFAGRRLETWSRKLLRAVQAIKEGRSEPVEPIRVQELDVITQSLIKAHYAKRKVQEELRRHEDHQEQMNAKLALSSIDGLTGLWQRQGFVDQVNQRLIQRPEEMGLAVTILFMDLDGFKAINDTQGHQSGDKILIDVGRVLRDIAGLSHVVGRWGGDEFVMCVFVPHDWTEAGIHELVTRIKRRIEAIGHNLGCSVGRAAWDRSINNLEQLIDRADESMYSEKMVARRRMSQLRVVRA